MAKRNFLVAINGKNLKRFRPLLARQEMSAHFMSCWQDKNRTFELLTVEGFQKNFFGPFSVLHDVYFLHEYLRSGLEYR